ncbi:hypothetical protein AABM17_683 [Neisseria musculi]|uniref:Uncharacterized protein n=1 Tax=Neisseria musculi TaxID=1815583 RepID=A0A7H1M849_9NEIS|nr:hypothetical protein H7A79_0684 [Neisseria musculi]
MIRLHHVIKFLNELVYIAGNRNDAGADMSLGTRKVILAAFPFVIDFLNKNRIRILIGYDIRFPFSRGIPQH